MMSNEDMETVESPDAAPHLALDGPIALVGMMGSGKSTVGRRLARRLNVPFVDSDDEVEAAAGCSIPEIFEQYGEDAFRQGECRVLGRLLDGTPKVVATGGGAFVHNASRALIAERAVTVWLQADLETLVERTARRDTRPLLRGGDPRARLAALLSQREPYYAEADIRVASSDGPHAHVVRDILNALDDYYNGTSR